MGASTACWIRLPLEVDDSNSSSRASSAFKGQRQDLQSNGVSKECILVIDREAGTITLEHVTSKIDVKQTREQEAKEIHFKPRQARKSKSSDTSSSYNEAPPRKQNRLSDTKLIPSSHKVKNSGNMPEIIGMSDGRDNSQTSGDGQNSQSNNPLGFLSSESDSNQDSSSSSSTSSDHSDESDDSKEGETTKQTNNDS